MLRRAAYRQRLFCQSPPPGAEQRRRHAKTPLPVIATSSTCTFTLRDEYPHLLDVDNQDLRDRIELATRWIWRQLDAGRTLPLRPLPLKVVYHTPCHMEKMGWSLYTLELLRLIPGLQLEVLDSQCCGIAGTYGFKSENYPSSQAIGAPLFRQIERAAPTWRSPIAKPANGKSRCPPANAVNIPSLCWRRRWPDIGARNQ
jgi:Fe-S oxidoreductase